jgi:hypothetical protein
MLSTIDFHHQSLLQTNEVNNVRSQRLLPPEFVAVKLPEAKMAPKQTLGVGWVVSKLTGSSS